METGLQKKSQNLSKDMSSEKYLEEILRPNLKRFTLFPIKYHDLWKMYKEGEAAFWVAEKLKLADDLIDWNEKMTDNERYFVERILAFFAQADGIVNENLLERFEREINVLEAQYFYRFQGMMENIHAESYALMIDTYIKDPVKKEMLFNAIEEIPCIKKKADWALKWITNDKATFGERLLAFACVEGIFFSGSFAAIFWLRKRGLMKGLAQANTFISRDEGLHQRFACKLYKDYLSTSKPSDERAYQIVKEACELEKEFQTESLPVSLIGMNNALMAQYIEYVSDVLLVMCGLEPVYHTTNPFDFMRLIDLYGQENMFEVQPQNYSMAVVSRDGEFTMDADF